MGDSKAELRQRKNAAPDEGRSDPRGSKAAKKERKRGRPGNGAGGGPLWQRALAFLFEPQDASYLPVFRVMWGFIMAYEAYTYMRRDWAKMIASFYSSPIQFKYFGFAWCVVPEDPELLKALVAVQAMSSICVMLGFFYRTNALIYTLSFGYMYLLEQAMYLNHFYLVCILSAMMVLLPCNCLWSLDALIWPKQCRSDSAPRWCLWFVRAELVTVYTYAGIAKLNEDWLRAQPLRQWLAGRHDVPVIGWILVRESTAYIMSYGGLIYDLVVGFALLFKLTLWPAVMASLFFHLTNKLVFNIGIFPWMMIASTVFFFDADATRYVMSLLRFKTYEPIVNTKKFKDVSARALTVVEVLILVGLALFFAHQILTPLRHWTYHDDVAWNEYGHQFSWRMKLRTKKCDSAAFAFDPELNEGNHIPLASFLNRRQYKKMSSRPDMILQFAHYMADYINNRKATMLSNATLGVTEIYVEAWCELNGRPWKMLVDPSYDLVKQEQWAYPYPWVTDVTPLPEELYADFPWNWEWNFNYLKGKDSTYLEPYEDHEDRYTRAVVMKRAAAERWEAMAHARARANGHEEAIIRGRP